MIDSTGPKLGAPAPPRNADPRSLSQAWYNALGYGRRQADAPPTGGRQTAAQTPGPEQRPARQADASVAGALQARLVARATSGGERRGAAIAADPLAFVPVLGRLCNDLARVANERSRLTYGAAATRAKITCVDGSEIRILAQSRNDSLHLTVVAPRKVHDIIASALGRVRERTTAGDVFFTFALTEELS